MSLTLERVDGDTSIQDDLTRIRNENYTAIEDAVNNKAESSDVYTQTETDNLLALKQDKAITIDEQSTTVESAIQANFDSIEDLQAQIDGKVYGIIINHTTGVCVRTGDAIGLTTGSPDGINPIASDFDNIYPWNSVEQYKQNEFGLIKRPTDDGYDTFDGSLRNKYGKVWISDLTIGDIRTIAISTVKKDGYIEIDPPAIDAIIAGDDNGILRAKTGLAPKVNISYTGFLNALESQGDGKDSMYDMKAVHYLYCLSVVEAGTLDHKTAYGKGINSGMPYSSSDDYKVVIASTNANTVTLDSLGQPFYVGMDVQIGTSYTNDNIASNRKITDITDDGTYLIITVDGDAFDTAIGNTIVTWGQSVSQEAIDAIGLGSGYYLQYGSENRSHNCYRGTWDFCGGNLWLFTAGFMRYNGQYYGCTDPTKMNITDPRGADGWVDLGLNIQADNGYQRIRKAIEIDGGYIDVPIEWGNVASSNTFYSAYLYYFSSAYQGARVLRLGGTWDYGSSVSPVCPYGVLTPSGSVFSVGSRVIRYN